MEAACELGCSTVVASGMSEGTLDDIIYELECVEKAAEEYKVKLSLENHCQNVLDVYKRQRLLLPYRRSNCGGHGITVSPISIRQLFLQTGIR